MRAEFRRAINPEDIKEDIKEAMRFTDLTFYERHLFPGDDVAQYDRVPDNSALWVEKEYTLEVAIRDNRSGIDSTNKPDRAVLNPRCSQEALKIYVVVRVVAGDFIKIDERVCKIRWPYNQDSESAFFRIAFTTLPARELQAAVDVRLYHENLDLLDIVRLQFYVVADMAAAARESLIVWPRTPAVPRLDPPDAAIRELNITISPADGAASGWTFFSSAIQTRLKLASKER